MPKLIKDSFSAWINKMPGGPHRLIAQGEAEVPTGGWRAELRPASTQGINQNILILEAFLIKPAGVVTQVISHIPCRYEESPPKHDYTHATIRYDGEEFTIDVGEAQ